MKDKELKCQKKQIDKIEAEWSKAQKDIMKARISVTDAEADILAREQSKNKLIAQCAENLRKHNYHRPVTSQDDVNLMFAKIQKFSEQDKLSLMRKEIKVKPVAKRHLVSGTLAPLYVVFGLKLGCSGAAAPIGDEVL